MRRSRQEQTALYRKRHPEKIRAYRIYYNAKNRRRNILMSRLHRLKKYGLTFETLKIKLDSQNGLCDICQITMKKPQIDHNHTTGRTRGLLCVRCNIGVGWIEDPIMASKAQDYLRRHDG